MTAVTICEAFQQTWRIRAHAVALGTPGDKRTMRWYELATGSSRPPRR